MTLQFSPLTMQHDRCDKDTPFHAEQHNRQILDSSVWYSSGWEPAQIDQHKAKIAKVLFIWSNKGLQDTRNNRTKQDPIEVARATIQIVIIPTLKRLATSPTEFFLLLYRRQNTWAILELINPDESKRAKKMLELAIPSLFSLDKRKARKLTLEPTLGCFHNLNES
jgi:hypothetical protein